MNQKLIFISIRLIKALIVALATASITPSLDALVLDCHFETKNVWTIQNVYTCEAEIRLFGDPRVVSDVSGSHIGFKTNLNVTGLSIVNQTMRDFLIDVEKFFPNLEVIRVQWTRLGEISVQDLAPFKALKQISFSNSLIQYINSDLFSHNSQLHSISFDNNPIRHVGHGAFNRLHQLASLRLGNTTCVHVQTDNDRNLVFAELYNIFRSCPPTIAMIEEEILLGPKFQEIVDQRVDEKTADLAQRIDDLESVVGSKDAINATLVDHGRLIGEQKIELGVLSETIEGLEDSIKQTNGKLAAQETTTAALTVRIDDIVNSDIRVLNETVSSQSVDINNNLRDISDHATKLGDLAGEDTRLGEEIVALSVTVGEHADLLDDLESRMPPPPS